MSYSQSRQDDFALLVTPWQGFYLDIGCSVPQWQNNSRALLEKGWTGVNVDRQDHAADWKDYPGAHFISADATTIDWRKLRNEGRIGNLVDYLSLDVDDLSLEALKNLLGSEIRFRCATIEHDAYRFGPMMRDSQKQLLLQHGYVLALEGIKSVGHEYENWFIDPTVARYQEIVQEVKKWGLT